jgi:hypothetical protein
MSEREAVKELRRRHSEAQSIPYAATPPTPLGYCLSDRARWPCDVAILLSTIEKQQEVIEAAEKAFVKVFDRIEALRTDSFSATEGPMHEAWAAYQTARAALGGKME